MCDRASLICHTIAAFQHVVVMMVSKFMHVHGSAGRAPQEGGHCCRLLPSLPQLARLSIAAAPAGQPAFNCRTDGVATQPVSTPGATWQTQVLIRLKRVAHSYSSRSCLCFMLIAIVSCSVMLQMQLILHGLHAPRRSQAKICNQSMLMQTSTRYQASETQKHILPIYTCSSRQT